MPGKSNTKFDVGNRHARVTFGCGRWICPLAVGWVFAVALTLVDEAKAGNISSIVEVVSTGSSSTSADPPFYVINDNVLNNDKEPADPSEVKTFDNSVLLFDQLIFSSGIRTVDLKFNVLDSGGTTEYYFPGLAIGNGTGDIWSGMKYVLGFGTGKDFEKVLPETGLDFDCGGASCPTKPFNELNNSAFSNVDISHTQLDWFDGAFGGPFPLQSSFLIDVPDHTGIPGPYQTPNGEGYHLTLRFASTPAPSTTPEPSTLVGFGLLGILLPWRPRGTRQHIA